MSKNKTILKYANETFRKNIAPLVKSREFSTGGTYQAGVHADEIIGHWHEDGNEFIITCPPQLRDCFLELLNNLNLIELVGEEIYE